MTDLAGPPPERTQPGVTRSRPNLALALAVVVALGAGVAAWPW